MTYSLSDQTRYSNIAMAILFANAQWRDLEYNDGEEEKDNQSAQEQVNCAAGAAAGGEGGCEGAATSVLGCASVMARTGAAACLGHPRARFVGGRLLFAGHVVGRVCVG